MSYVMRILLFSAQKKIFTVNVQKNEVPSILQITKDWTPISQSVMKRPNWGCLNRISQRKRTRCGRRRGRWGKM